MLLNKWFIVDLFNIGIDFLAGILISLIFFHPNLSFDIPLVSILAGAIGGVAPDPLQFLYWKIPNRFLTVLQKFHIHFAHSKIDIDSRHLLGISSQVLLSVAAIMTANWLAGR